MQAALYHKDIYLPAPIATLGKRTITPRITGHAMDAAKADRYGAISIPSQVTFSGSDVVEAELREGRVVKLVVRVPYDGTRDLVLAIGFDKGASFIKTVWFNLANDVHSTLQRERYATK